MSFTRKTFRESTAPGYFDFSPAQTEKTRRMVDWFDRFTARLQDQVNLYDQTFRLWASRDYTGVTPSQNLYLYYLSQSIRFVWLQGSLNVERDLLSYLLAPRPETFADCINQLYNLLVQIGWTTNIGQVVAGKGTPIMFAETLVIYSNSPYLPSTPGNTAYIRRGWEPPQGWTRAPSSSTYLCRGYLYGSEIVWLPPVSTSGPWGYIDVAALGDLPGSAIDGDVAGVFDDGSGDTGAIYTYYDGNWYKVSTLYDLQGSVFANTYLDSSGIFAPDDPSITSQTPPPEDGPSRGYGFYGMWGVNPSAEVVEMVLTLTDAGFANLGVIALLFRKIKPYENRVILYALYNDVVYQLDIKDSEAIY